MAFIIILLAVLSWKIYKSSDIFQLKCIISSVDGNKYCVRDRKKLKESADHLAKVSVNLTKIVEYCKEKFPEESEMIQQFHDGWEVMLKDQIPENTKLLSQFDREKFRLWGLTNWSGETFPIALERFDFSFIDFTHLPLPKYPSFIFLVECLPI